MHVTPSFLSFFLINLTTGFLTPKPHGKYNVTLTTGKLVDYDRNGRALMLSVFQPATCESTVPVPYMPEKTAKYQGEFLKAIFNLDFDLTPLFLEARLPVCLDHPDSSTSHDDKPIVLFSPGYSIPRLYYSVLASAIASEGFIVITMDHPGDANIITYPDGHTVLNNDVSQSTAAMKKNIPIRAADASFFIDQLKNKTAMGQLIPKRGPKPFETKRVAMFGHSLGGVSSVIAAGQDSRIRGAINWDGTFFKLPTGKGTSQPVLLMSHGMADDSWPEAWPLLTGPKLWVDIADTKHQTFSDIPTLLESAGQDPASLGEVLGTIPPANMVKILATYTTAWMNGVFKKKIGGLLLSGDEPNPFPRVTTVRSANF
jgi:dienelactone hydrolase